MTSTVIKVGQAGPILNRVAAVDLADHLAEARAVVEAAKRQAAGILVQTRQQRNTMFEEAMAAGYKEGYELGRKEGAEAGHEAAHRDATERFDAQHADLVADMQRAIGEIDAVKEDLRIEAEQHVLDFAVQVTRKLTFEIGRLHRESAVENLKRALRLVAQKTDLSIRVHPDDVASMETFAESVLKRADASQVISLVATESIAPGGCTVTTDRTEVDATLETQVDQMVSLLLGEKADHA